MVRFVSGHYQSYDIPREPTIGAFFVTKRMTCVQQNMTCKLLLWDTAGQEQYTKFASTYYQNAAAAIITYDITQPQSIQRLSYWLEELHRNITITGDRRIVLCVAACKCDVMNSSSNSQNDSDTNDGGTHHGSNTTTTTTTTGTNETTTTTTPPHPQQLQQIQQQYQYALDEGKRLSEQYSAIFVNTSAKENMGISFLFEQLCHRVLQYQYEYEMNPTNVVPIPVTVVSTTTSNGVQSPTHNVKQHMYPKRTPPIAVVSPTNNNIQRKLPFTTTTTTTNPHDMTTTTTNDTVATTIGTVVPTIMSTLTNAANPITVSDESDSSRTLPTQHDPMVITESIHNNKTITTTGSNMNQYNNSNTNNNDDTILTDDQYAIPANLRKTATISDMDDRSYGTHTTHSQNYNNNNININPCNPICGDHDTVTAFVCGTDRNPSSCQIM